MSEIVPPTPEESVSFALSGKSGGKEGRLLQELREMVTDEFVESSHARKQSAVDELRAIGWPEEEVEKKKAEFDARRKEGMAELRAYFKANQGEDDLEELKKGAKLIMNRFLTE